MLLAEVRIVLAPVLPGDEVFVELGKIPKLLRKAVIEKFCTFFLKFGFALGDDATVPTPVPAFVTRTA